MIGTIPATRMARLAGLHDWHRRIHKQIAALDMAGVTEVPIDVRDLDWLLADIEWLSAALRWYADESNYEITWRNPEHGVGTHQEAFEDSGGRARAALEEAA